MMLAEQMRELTIGDPVTTPQQHVGRPGRHGKIVEAATELGHERCRVRWDDGGETLVYPGTAVSVESRTTETDALVT